MNFIGSLLVAPELIGLQRLSSYERTLERRLKFTEEHPTIIIMGTFRKGFRWYLRLIFILIPLFICFAVSLTVVKYQEISQYVGQYTSGSSSITFVVIVSGLLLAIAIILFVVPRLAVELTTFVSSSIATVLFKSVKVGLKILSGSNVFRKLIVRSGLVLIIIGTLLQLIKN